MKHSLVNILKFYFGLILAFLLFQKPLFLVYNHQFGENWDVKTVWDIYENGFFSDVATTSILTIVPLLVCLGWWLRKRSTWDGMCSKGILCFFKLYSGVMAFVVMLGSLADTCLYEFWQFKLDKTVFPYMMDPKNAVASVSWGYLVCCFVAWMVLGCGCYAIVKPVKGLKRATKKRAVKKWIAVVVFVLLGGLDFLSIRSWDILPNTPAKACFSQVQFYNHAALNPIYNLFYSLTKSEIDASQFAYYDAEEARAVVDELFPRKADTTEMLLKTQRPNVLLVLLESMSSCFVECQGGLKKTGENLSDLIPTGVSFENCYCGSFRTDRALVCIESGYLGQPTTSIIRFTRKIHNLPGLPRTLKEAGYETTAVYGGDATFYNILDYFVAVGHERVVTELDFSEEKRTQQWGIPDHEMLNWLYEDILHKENGRPWFTTFLSLSSHDPFDVPSTRYNDPIMNGFAYTDSCFGDFVRRISKTPAWDNLLLVVMADHGFNAITKFETPDFPKIPFVLLGGAVKEPRKIETLMNQTDFPAILLGQMGLPHEDFLFSRDVLGNTYRYPFALNVIKDGFNFRDSTGCTIFDTSADRTIYGEDSLREKKGKMILQRLYDDMSKR